MSGTGRVSPSAIASSSWISSTPGPQANLPTPQEEAQGATPVRVRRNDAGQRLKVFSGSAKDAILSCKDTMAGIDHRINTLISAAQAPNAWIDAQSISPLIEAYREAELTYENALKTLRCVPGITSRENGNPAVRDALKTFLSGRENAALSRKLYLALQATITADDAVLERDELYSTEAGNNLSESDIEQRQAPLQLAALENYEKAVDILSGFKTADLGTSQRLPYQEVTDAKELLKHALFNDIQFREIVFEDSNRELQRKIEFYRGDECNILHNLRGIREEIHNNPELAPEDRNEKLRANSERLHLRSSRLLGQLPAVIAEAKALLPENAALMQRLLVEKKYFPDSPQNLMSLLETITADLNIHYDIIELQSITQHEFLHKIALNKQMDNHQFEHLNRIHDNVMLLQRFHKRMKKEVPDSPEDARCGSIGASLDLLKSAFSISSQQLRYHSHIMLSRESENDDYRQAASLLGELAEDYLAASQQAHLAKNMLIEHELVPPGTQTSQTVKEWKANVANISWDLPPWLSEDLDDESAPKAGTPAVAAQSTQSRQAKGQGGNKAALARAVKLQAGIDALAATETLERRSLHFSNLSSSALQDAGSRLAQMRGGKLSDQHTWSTIRFLVNVACENKEKELTFIRKALDRLQPVQGQPGVSAKHSSLNTRSKALTRELQALKRDAMRDTLDAIMLRPTDQGIQYLHEHGKISGVSQPTWVELKNPDDEFKDEKDRSPKHYVIEYVMTFKADENAKSRQCVLHAHHHRPDPPYNTPPLKSHYKRYEERLLGKASEIRLADGSVLNPVYRNMDASNGIRIVHEMLPAEKRTPVPRAQASRS